MGKRHTPCTNFCCRFNVWHCCIDNTIIDLDVFVIFANVCVCVRVYVLICVYISLYTRIRVEWTIFFFVLERVDMQVCTYIYAIFQPCVGFDKSKDVFIWYAEMVLVSSLAHLLYNFHIFPMYVFFFIWKFLFWYYQRSFIWTNKSNACCILYYINKIHEY